MSSRCIGGIELDKQSARTKLKKILGAHCGRRGWERRFWEAGTLASQVVLPKRVSLGWSEDVLFGKTCCGDILPPW